MELIYGKNDFSTLKRGQEVCWLLTNGLGGFSSQTMTGGASRCDQALLMACNHAPNERWNLVHRLSERLTVGGAACWLSSQQLTNRPGEDGWRQMDSFYWDGLPHWQSHFEGMEVEKCIAMAYGENTVAVRYQLTNDSPEGCTLSVTPWLLFAPKGQEPPSHQGICIKDGCLQGNGQKLYLLTNGRLTSFPQCIQSLYYPADERDGRRRSGQAKAVCRVTFFVPAGERATLELVFSTRADPVSAGDIICAAQARCAALAEQSGLHDPAARRLAVSADAFLSRRESTNGMTILAGYPIFEDWGRDTMIALPGCTLATHRFGDAKSILRTFMAYEKDGLMPNLFPEGGQKPQYNTADAALLFINCIYLYYQATRDADFVCEAWPVMEHIVHCYTAGTHHGIRVDSDGLLAAGHGLDQVTWMDVRVSDILPTPRHGKPVELNAYWYNALRILETLAPLAAKDSTPYAAQAAHTKENFCRKFWREDVGCLKDLISGTDADDQIRCNQIWAVSMSFAMLSPEQERCVVRTVYTKLYTPLGLRTLDPADGQFHAEYSGEQFDRDMAYHQGTVWAYPLGAYYLAYLKTENYSPAAKARVRRQLISLEAGLREGCVGQIAEIYDGGNPTASRGAFAQAWSVGELLRAYAALESDEHEDINNA